MRWPRRLLNALGPNPSPGQVAAALRALAPDETGRPDRDAIARFLDSRAGARRRPDDDRVAGVDERARPAAAVQTDRSRTTCRRSSPTRSIRPSRARPPLNACSRRCPASRTSVRSRSNPNLIFRSGVFSLTTRRTGCFPAPATSRTATSWRSSTNPTFVESLLVGANHQTTAELRWRNVPLTTRWSPLRKFWQRAGSRVRHPADQELAGRGCARQQRLSCRTAATRKPSWCSGPRCSADIRRPSSISIQSANDWDAPEPGDDLNAERDRSRPSRERSARTSRSSASRSHRRRSRRIGWSSKNRRLAIASTMRTTVVPQVPPDSERRRGTARPTSPISGSRCRCVC